MKKEKTVRTYQRRTKSGKIVTVRQHTSKYDAAERAKDSSKRKGAGEELEKVKTKKALQKADLFGGYDFSEEDFNEWYEGTGSANDKKVAKALRKTLGRKAYDELSDLAADNYKKGGASSFFKKNIHSKTAETKTSNRTKKGAAISKRMTLDEYLGSKGLSSPVSDFMIDKTKLPHGLTQRGKEKLRKEADKAANEYQEKRAAAIKEYKKLAKEGKIVAPTSSEQLNKIAEGHPDNASTQAAKRVLEKRAAKTEKANDYTIVKGPGMMGGEFAVKDGKAYTRDVTKKNPKWKPMKEGPVQSKVLEYYKDSQAPSDLAEYKGSSKLKRKTSTKPSSANAKETSAELRRRANEMDAREKQAKISEKVGKGYKTIKNAALNNPAPRSRTAQLRGNVYISSDRTTAYYEDPLNKGKLKKASAALLRRLTGEKSVKSSSENAKVSKPKEEYKAYKKLMDEKQKTGKRLSITETTKLKKLAKAAGVGRFIE